MEPVLEGVDDHVSSTVRSKGDEGLADRQSRTSVGETDFDHHACVLGEQEVPEHIAVAVGDRHTVEIAFTADLARADFGQLAAHLPDAPQDLDTGRHEPSIAEARRPPLTRGAGSFAWF